VRDAVRDAGFAKPRIEGEANGEWIIVDCAQAVVHIMQPNFRQYYHLEELWGERPVRLKLGSAKPVGLVKAQAEPAKEKTPTTLKRSNAAKKGVAEAFPSKAQVKKNLAAKSAAKPASKSAGKPVSKPAAKKAPSVKTAAKTLVVNAPVKAKAPAKTASKAPAKKAPAKKTAPRKA
jgi:ribosome-associated protein